MKPPSTKIYLLDANVLINAHGLYYPIDMIPEFWEWIRHKATEGLIKMPIETFEEVRGGKKDLLTIWMHEKETLDHLMLKEEVDGAALNSVLSTGYATDLTDTEIEQVGRDPFLVAYGMNTRHSRSIVSEEISKPSKQRANRKVPDVCSSVGVECCNTFSMLRNLGFKTGWNR